MVTASRRTRAGGCRLALDSLSRSRNVTFSIHQCLTACRIKRAERLPVACQFVLFSTHDPSLMTYVSLARLVLSAKRERSALTGPAQPATAAS